MQANKRSTDFQELIDYMISPTLEMDGCECMFPDSVFFDKDGKPN